MGSRGRDSVEAAQKKRIDRIHSRYRHFMHTIAFSVLRDHEDAEDAVQLSLEKLSRNVGSLSGSGSPKALIGTVTRRTAIDLLRQRDRRGEVPLEEWSGLAASPDPEEALAVKRCIRRLPDKYREAILLRYSYGYNVQEMARILALTESAVYKRLENARDLLETFCREEELL